MAESLRIRKVSVSNSRLQEGSYHSFTILKSMSLGDNDTYFVLRDPLGYKVLLPAHFYLHYGFEQGQEIECRVDRINCDGKMFIEPVHPFYKEGEVYKFSVLGAGSRSGITGEQEFFIKIADVFGQEWDVKVFSEKYLKSLKNTIKCRLERIKKGKLFLSIACSKPSGPGLEVGKTYTFEITDETISPSDRMRYFIVNDESGNKHILNKKYYAHYGLKVGQTIRCRVEKFTSDGFFFLEPENPWYRVGETYSFSVIEMQKLIFSDGSLQYVVLLDDLHGDPVKTFISPTQAEDIGKLTTLNCRLVRLRKSRLELEVILK